MKVTTPALRGHIWHAATVSNAQPPANKAMVKVNVVHAIFSREGTNVNVHNVREDTGYAPLIGADGYLQDHRNAWGPGAKDPGTALCAEQHRRQSPPQPNPNLTPPPPACHAPCIESYG